MKEQLTEALRKNKTIDWQKRQSAHAAMKILVKRLLKRHKCPLEDLEDAMQTVVSQCGLWADNID